MNGFRLRELRNLVGLRQTEVAKYLGVDNETVCRWEKRGRELTKLQDEAVRELVGDGDVVAELKRGRAKVDRSPRGGRGEAE